MAQKTAGSVCLPGAGIPGIEDQPLSNDYQGAINDKIESY
jgi:hypothetical protein